MAEPLSLLAGSLASTAGLLFGEFSTIFRRRRTSPPINFEISTLYDTPNSQVDIVFVHGLGSNSSNAWTCTDESTGRQTSWPVTELPTRLRTKARILAYDYDTEVRTVEYVVSRTLMHQTKRLVEALTRCRKESPRRPIIFVCHSLGGIVVKNALVHARSSREQEFKQVYDAVYGIVFLGTPHTTSPKALADNLTDVLGLDAKSPVYNELRNRSTTLACSLERFKPLATSLSIYAITGTSSLSHRNSGLGNQPGNNQHIYVSVDRDYAHLTRFASRTDDDLLRYITCIDTLCSKAVNSTIRDTAQEEEPNVPWQLHDIGISETLETRLERNPPILQPSEIKHLASLENSFSQWFQDGPSTADPDAWPIAILQGPRGSGKTQTALRYVSRHRDEYSSILWVNATSRSSLGSSYREIASRIISKCSASAPPAQLLGLDGDSFRDDQEPGPSLNGDDLRQVEQAVMEWLARPHEKKWLLVLDGLSPNSGYPLSPAWTGWLDKDTRAKDWWREFLGNLPSTAGNRGHVIISTRSKPPVLGPQIISFTTPRENWPNEQLRFPVPNPLDTRFRFRKWWQTAQAWEKRTLEVALFLSDVDCPRIPIFLLQRELGGDEATRAFTLEDLEIEGPYLRLSNDFLVEGPLLLSHQSFVGDREWMSKTVKFDTESAEPEVVKSEVTDELDKAIIRVLKRAWEVLSDGLQTIRNRRDLVMAWDDEEQVIRNISTLLRRRKTLTVQLVGERPVNLMDLAAICETHAKYITARKLYNLERERHDLWGEADFALRLHCARIYQRSGQYSEAEDQYREIFSSKYSKVFATPGIANPVDSRISAYRLFASMRASQGKFDEAVKQLSHVLALEDPFGNDADQAQVTESIGELALYLFRSGNEQAASASLQRILASLEKTRGSMHPATLNTMEMLSTITLKSGQMDETQRLLDAVHKSQQDRLGENHPKTVLCRSKIAAAMDLAGDTNNAKDMYVECLEAAGECLGPRHPTVFSIRKDFAYCLLTLGKQAEARKELEKLAHEFENSPDLYSSRVRDSINGLLDQDGDIHPVERDSDFAARSTLGIGGFHLEEDEFSEGESDGSFY
ncbi:hypothetical protein ACHAPT_011932 [Fusarium lateritium]